MASSAGSAFGVRRPDRSVGGMRRQGPVDRFDEAVGEDERIQEGSFGLDPGMRAADEFQDVASAGYRENAKRVAERGGAEQYSTSVGQEEGEAEADELRNAVALILASLIGGGAIGGAARGFGAARAGGAGIGRAAGAGAAESVGRGPFNLWGEYIPGLQSGGLASSIRAPLRGRLPAGWTPSSGSMTSRPQMSDARLRRRYPHGWGDPHPRPGQPGQAPYRN